MIQLVHDWIVAMAGFKSNGTGHMLDFSSFSLNKEFKLILAIF